MTNDIELEAFGHRAGKIRLIAQGIYNTKERLALIAFVSEAEQMAAELVESNRQRTWEPDFRASTLGRKRSFQ